MNKLCIKNVHRNKITTSTHLYFNLVWTEILIDRTQTLYIKKSDTNKLKNHVNLSFKKLKFKNKIISKLQEKKNQKQKILLKVHLVF